MCMECALHNAARGVLCQWIPCSTIPYHTIVIYIVNTSVHYYTAVAKNLLTLFGWCAGNLWLHLRCGAICVSPVLSTRASSSSTPRLQAPTVSHLSHVCTPLAVHCSILTCAFSCSFMYIVHSVPAASCWAGDTGQTTVGNCQHGAHCDMATVCG